MIIETNGQYTFEVALNTDDMRENFRMVYIGFNDTSDGYYATCASISYENTIQLRDELNNIIQQKEDFDKQQQEEKQKEMREKINQYEQLKKELQEYGYLK